MAITGSFGANAATTTFKTPVSLGVSAPTQQYPSGSFSFNFTDTGTYRKAWQRVSGTSTQIKITLYLCDSSGNNKVKLCTVSGFTSQANFLYTPTSGTITNSSELLTGKALYLIASGDTSYIGTYGAIELTLNTTKKKYTLTMATSPSAGGTATGGGTYAYGSSRAISASANTGYSFNNWTKTAGTLASTTNASTTFTIPASNATVTANFTHNSYTLSKDVSPSGAGTVTTSKSTAYYNDSITITANPATGYSFSKWTKTYGTIANSGAASTTFTMPARDASITAYFVQDAHTITTVSSPSAGGTVTCSDGSAIAGEEITVTAVPNAGYQFSSWSSSPSVTITNGVFDMPASDITVTANFTKITYAISKAVNPTNAGTISTSSDTGQVGDTITLTQATNDGFAFDNYTTDPSVTVSNDQFTMPASDITITANFHGVPTTASLNKTSYSGGETAAVILTGATDAFTHTYLLYFGENMHTGWVDVPAEASSISVYVPVEWSTHILSGTSVTGGYFKVRTYNNGTYLGTTTIYNLTYTARDNTIPKIDVWRCDQSGNTSIAGNYGRYSITKPSSITSYRLICNGTTVSQPALTGDILPNNKVQFNQNASNSITLSLTYGAETFTVRKDIPKVIVVKKVI